jgi:hypothetical protein
MPTTPIFLEHTDIYKKLVVAARPDDRFQLDISGRNKENARLSQWAASPNQIWLCSSAG